jgi:hypothetical protein
VTLQPSNAPRWSPPPPAAIARRRSAQPSTKGASEPTSEPANKNMEHAEPCSDGGSSDCSVARKLPNQHSENSRHAKNHLVGASGYGLAFGLATSA